MKAITYIFSFLLLIISCDSEKTAAKSTGSNIPTKSVEKSLEHAPISRLPLEKPEVTDSKSLKQKLSINPITKGTPFDESLSGTDRLILLREFAESNDDSAIQSLLAHIDIPFLDPEKQNLSTVLTSPDWEVFPCLQILKKKGEAIVPFIIQELEHPSPSKSIWYNEEGAKQRMLLKVLRSLVGRERTNELLKGMEAGPGKSSAITIWESMNPTASRTD